MMTQMMAGKKLGLLATVLILLSILSSCSDPKSQLENIYERGEIRIVTKNGPTTYYFEKDVETGLEYELASRFAEFLGLPLKIVIAKNTAEVIELINNGVADVAAAALVESTINNKKLNYGPRYHWIIQNVVYRNGSPRPQTLNDIAPHQLHFAEGTLQERELVLLEQQHPELLWVAHPDTDTQELLEKIETKEILYTLADSSELVMSRLYFPELRAAFTLSTDPEPLVWAYRKLEDESLPNVINDFFKHLDENETVAELIDHFYGRSGTFDYVDSRKFVDRFYNRLPEYQSMFQVAATDNDIDWRLLASLAYQESHWDEKAVSPTGVRGLMMLTQTTAESVGVTNRLDPGQSITGGTTYLRSLMGRVPERILEPHKTWFALAAYNVGLGHVEDARVITEKQGADPDNWNAVKERLPLLSTKKWYKDTKYGYARGREPVIFVEKIRRYYSALIHLTQPVQAAEPKLQLVEAILIDSPVL
jgi:membrane-bound lytic murein transglycosylase F